MEKEKAPDSPSATIGFLLADDTVAGSRSGARRSCASIFVRSRSVSELRSDSDGIHFDTRTPLYCEVSARSSK
jgi:hypothetical protein